jgi:hypothetical protein
VIVSADPLTAIKSTETIQNINIIFFIINLFA